MITVTKGKADWVRVTKLNPCPICDKPDWCEISADGKVAICARVQSDKKAGNAGWLHNLTEDYKSVLPLPPKKQAIKQSPIASPAVRHSVYHALLSVLPLSESQHNDLLKRGLTAGQITQLGYKTLPVAGRRTVVHRLTTAGIELAGVPGFWLESGEIRLAGPAGMLIPIKDTKRRIIALQVRCDNVENGSRYKWLSSNGYFAGCSPGAPGHVAGPVSTNGEVWITEGPLKADIATLKLGCVVLAVPGVSNWPSVIPVIRELAPVRAIVAFDMDKLLNPVVNLHKDALIAYLIKCGIRTFEADWNVEFKGLDDLLTSEDQSCQR